MKGSDEKLHLAYLFLYEDSTQARRWGFPKEEDALEEIGRLKGRVKETLKDMKVELIGGHIIRSENDILLHYKEISSADAVLVFCLIAGPPPYSISLTKVYGRSLEALWAFNVPMILFVKATEEQIYDGNLRIYPFVKEIEEMTRDRPNVWLVINDFSRVRRLLKVLKAVKDLKELKIISFGPPAFMLGSYKAMRVIKEKIGTTIILFPYDVLVKEYKGIKEEEAAGMVSEFLFKAKGLDEMTREEANKEGVKSARLYLALKRIMEKEGASVVTINCYEGGLAALKEVTPCFALSKLNDEGFIGVCEADFPALIAMCLIRLLTGKPSFMADVVIMPEKNWLILSHCSSPLRLTDGRNELPYRVTTHYETGTGITAKVEFKENENVTVIAPSFDLSKALIIKGSVVGNLELPICRNQVIVKVSNATSLIENYVGFHWVMVYGDHVEELEEAFTLMNIKSLIL